MKLSTLESRFEIKDLTSLHAGSIDNPRHGDLFPSTIRCLITGPSNCGKTNILLNLIYNRNGIRFKNIYLYSKSIHQDKYKQLATILQGINEIGFFPYQNCDDVIAPSDAKPNSVVIFDDCITDKQRFIEEYFSSGRHFQLDTIYLAQCYTRVPKHLIRDNVNFLIIFPQDLLNLKHIYNDHVGADMPFDKFYKMCLYVWNDCRFNVLVINKDAERDCGRYRKGFDTIIKL